MKYDFMQLSCNVSPVGIKYVLDVLEKIVKVGLKFCYRLIGIFIYHYLINRSKHVTVLF